MISASMMDKKKAIAPNYLALADDMIQPPLPCLDKNPVSAFSHSGRRRDTYVLDSYLTGRQRNRDSYFKSFLKAEMDALETEEYIINYVPFSEWGLDNPREEVSTSLLSDKVADLLKNASSILQLKENWDSEGARAYSSQTFDEVSRFLKSSVEEVIRQKLSFDMPIISPADEGSVDVFWDGAVDLLVNFPEVGKFARYSGARASGERCTGRFLKSEFPRELIGWLTR